MPEALDFARSYAGWKADFNWTRIAVEAKCDLVDAAGAVDPYVLIASCKAENTYADFELIKQPSYDFCAIFGREDFLIVRTFITSESEKPDVRRDYGRIRDRFAEDNLHLEMHETATPLQDASDIIEATLSGHPLVARTELADEATQQRAVLEYPVKTINILPSKGLWQVDTGPLLLPDFSRTDGRPIQRLVLAFSVFNRLDCTEFVVRRPTPVQQEGRVACHVDHYSEVKVMEAKNTLLCGGEL